MMASLHTVFGIFQTDLTKLHEILTNLSVWKGMALHVVALELNSALPEQLSTAALSVSGFLMGRPEANKHITMEMQIQTTMILSPYTCQNG